MRSGIRTTGSQNDKGRACKGGKSSLMEALIEALTGLSFLIAGPTEPPIDGTEEGLGFTDDQTAVGILLIEEPLL